jgi:hypothetical protein
MEQQEFTPIIRMTSHAGTSHPIAIVTPPFFSHGELRAEIFDFDAGARSEVSVYWVNGFTRPAHRGDSIYEARLAELLTGICPEHYPTPIFDRGATEPMQSWMGARVAK